MVIAVPITMRDRLQGALVGCLIGDALGVPVEFSTRRERDRDPVRGMRGFGTHAQPAGTWSDDGALTLAHADMFVRSGWDPEKHLQAFIAWRDGGTYSAHGTVFDIGLTTERALARYRSGSQATHSGCDLERDNGNGSLMRILPASCWFAGSPPNEFMHNLGEVSALTHSHIRSRCACAMHGFVVDGLLSRRSIISSLLRAAEHLLPALPLAERQRFASLCDASCLDVVRQRVPSDGHVLSTLHASCWCLHKHRDFSAAVLCAVNLGGDTDTNAAVVGGLAGLRSGLSGIPRGWVSALPQSRAVVALSERFAEACIQAWDRRALER